MIPIFYALLVSSFIIFTNGEQYRFQHWNLRFDKINDGVSISDTLKSYSPSLPDESNLKYYSDYEEVSWSKRRIGIVNDVLFNKADIFTVNEALYNQVQDLKTLLNSLGDGDTWDYIGNGIKDGLLSGEFEAIFYKSKFTLESALTIWLSKTPFIPSQYPGSNNYRTATIGRFLTSSGSEFTLINTHLDNESDDQRKYGASMIRYYAAYIYEFFEGPIFLMGDLNSQYMGSTSGAYSILTGASNISSDIDSTFLNKYSNTNATQFKFADLYTTVEPYKRSGHYDTHTGFKAVGDTSSMTGKIDFVFGGVTDNSTLDESYTVQRYRVNENFYDLEFHLSDHRSIIVDVEF